MSRKSIDGSVIKNRNSIDMVKQGNKEKMKSEDSDEESSSHNIFGSKDNVTISSDLKEKLGLRDEKKEKPSNKGRAGGGKSILKKNSVLLTDKSEKKEKEKEKE